VEEEGREEQNTEERRKKTEDRRQKARGATAATGTAAFQNPFRPLLSPANGQNFFAGKAGDL
jgi:hypothetical protein